MTGRQVGARVEQGHEEGGLLQVVGDVVGLLDEALQEARFVRDGAVPRASFSSSVGVALPGLGARGELLRLGGAAAVAQSLQRVAHAPRRSRRPAPRARRRGRAGRARSRARGATAPRGPRRSRAPPAGPRGAASDAVRSTNCMKSVARRARAGPPATGRGAVRPRREVERLEDHPVAAGRRNAMWPRSSSAAHRSSRITSSCGAGGAGACGPCSSR